MATFNEFNREIQKRISDPEVRFILLAQFEMIQHLSKEMNEFASLLLNLANQQQRFAELNAATQEQLKQLSRRGTPDGISIVSEPIDPEERH